MSTLTGVAESKALCDGIYTQFAKMVTELTELCSESELRLEEYRKNLESTAIPDIVSLRERCHAIVDTGLCRKEDESLERAE